ncbi:MAG: hypothetical protein PHX21_12615 [bacterium]|nr:hypothetical protein [bacterium]
MKIISFAHTSLSLISGKKSETRRFWPDKYASTFKSGDLVQGWSKSPRFKGQLIAIIQLVQDPFKQPLREVTEQDQINEGNLWGNAAGYIKAMGGPDLVPYVVKFKLKKILGKKCLTCRNKFETICNDNYRTISRSQSPFIIFGPSILNPKCLPYGTPGSNITPTINPIIVEELLHDGVVKEIK